jgi:excisionase family DNA binding protein
MEKNPEAWTEAAEELAADLGVAPGELVRLGAEALRRSRGFPGSPGPGAPLPVDAAALAREIAAVVRLPSLVPVADAARLLRVSLSTMRRRIRGGDIPVRRIGRSVRVDLAALRPLGDGEVARLARASRR